MLVAIAVAFRNDVIGTLLGDAVALRVRSVDLLAAVAAVLLGGLAVADVLYINIRERSAELAALWASGWTDRALLRLVGYEGLGIGILGALTGALAGLGGIAWLVGGLTSDIVWLAAIVAAAAIGVATLAACVPALLLRRFPLSTLLAEE
jgi:putative ABC transport system permease protein